MLSRCAAVRGSGQGREKVLRRRGGGGEVDLDKRAITGEDDIVELDQLDPQQTGPPATRHDSDPTRAEQAKPLGATTGATPTPSTGEAKPPRRIVVLSDETGNRDARHSDRPITAAPDHPTLAAAAPLPGTLRERPLPTRESNLGLPRACVTTPTQPLQTAPVPTDDAPQAAATGHRRSHPHARAHRRGCHRAGRWRPRPSRARSPNDGIGPHHELNADPIDHPARRYRRRPPTRSG